jgi:hypothetical protein
LSPSAPRISLSFGRLGSTSCADGGGGSLDGEGLGKSAVAQDAVDSRGLDLSGAAAPAWDIRAANCRNGRGKAGSLWRPN